MASESGRAPGASDTAARGPRVRAMRQAAAPRRSFDHERLQEGVRLILEGLGLEPESERLRSTPERVARMYDELLSGLLVDPADVLDVVFEERHDELVLVRDISFASICEHHLVPFIGRAHVGYIPNANGQVTGLSKLSRLVDVVSKQPSMQERITTTIADTLEAVLSPRGVLVLIEAEHYCMTMRGVRKPGAVTVTSAVRGLMRSDPRSRAEVMALATRSRSSAT
jgi:GTP cyclohydrolase I